MEYLEEDYLQLSGIQHFLFCRRQWALIHIEHCWEENLRTTEGKILHENAHDAFFKESRKNVFISRAMPVCSRELGISGECDVVEFHKSSEGVPLHGREGTYRIYPIEYKRGKQKDENYDVMQLVAQSMCLEEMFVTNITEGALYYAETRTRQKVTITTEMKQTVKNIFCEMHTLMKRGYTPKAKVSKSCNACSLKEICLPKISKMLSAHAYNTDFFQSL